MSTSEGGFSLIELLVAVTISVLLALSVAPVWTGLQSAGATAADHVTLACQSRVAVAKLERDLRMATADPAGQAEGASILRAGPREMVLLVGSSGAVEVVEWEIAGDALMRRRGPWVARDVGSLSHAWYIDHKTMLRGVVTGPGFSYIALGTESATVESGPDTVRIEVVRLRGTVRPSEAGAGSIVDLRMWGRVGR